jgi:hypothetical protein
MEKITCVKKSANLRVRKGFFWFFCAFKFADILSMFCQCFADFYEMMFSGPRQFFHRNDFCNTAF